MLLNKVLAAMPQQEPLESILERLNSLIFEEARNGRKDIIIKFDQVPNFYILKNEIVARYRKEGFKVFDHTDSLLVIWKK